jgi:hypothetical protein
MWQWRTEQHLSMRGAAERLGVSHSTWGALRFGLLPTMPSAPAVSKNSFAPTRGFRVFWMWWRSFRRKRLIYCSRLRTISENGTNKAIRFAEKFVPRIVFVVLLRHMRPVMLAMANPAAWRE